MLVYSLLAHVPENLQCIAAPLIMPTSKLCRQSHILRVLQLLRIVEGLKPKP